MDTILTWYAWPEFSTAFSTAYSTCLLQATPGPLLTCWPVLPSLFKGLFFLHLTTGFWCAHLTYSLWVPLSNSMISTTTKKPLDLLLSSKPVYPILLTSFSSVQLLSRVWLFATPWIATRQASLSITNSRSSLKLTSIESVMPSSHLILCHPLFLLPLIPPSLRDFSNESTLHMSFSFSIIPSKEHPGLISFRMDWLDLLVVQGTLKSLLQHHSSKASILQRSAFLTVQLSHPYMTFPTKPEWKPSTLLLTSRWSSWGTENADLSNSEARECMLPPFQVP